MDEYMVTLRVIHILAGVFWVGAAMFVFFFLEPAIAKSGPAGGQVMGAIAGSKMPLAMTASSFLSVLTGVLMYWRNGYYSDWSSSPTSLAFTIGGAAAILAFLEGLAIHMPLQIKMKKLGQQIQAAGGPPSQELVSQGEEMRRKLKHAALWSVVLVDIAVVAMASARYL